MDHRPEPLVDQRAEPPVDLRRQICPIGSQPLALRVSLASP